MRKFIFTMMILGLSLNIYAGQLGEKQMAECTESVQSSRSQEGVAVKENTSSSKEESKSNER